VIELDVHVPTSSNFSLGGELRVIIQLQTPLGAERKMKREVEEARSRRVDSDFEISTKVLQQVISIRVIRHY
jgi:hypothetical protein